MKITTLLATLLLLGTSTSIAAESDKKPEKNERIVITTDKELSYALGIKIAQEWREEGFVVDPKIVAIAIEDVQNYGPRRLSTEAGTRAIFIERDRIKRAKDAVWKEKRKAANAFMEENKNGEGVVTLDSGLQYVIHNIGEGTSPAPDSIISVSYTGVSATNGAIFGRVKAPKEGSEFNMGKVIEGWKEGLPLIKEGGKITLYIPAHLAYGKKGIQHRNAYIIEPNDALVFDIELVKVIK